MRSARIPPNHGKTAAEKIPTTQTTIESNVNTPKKMARYFLMRMKWPND